MRIRDRFAASLLLCGLVLVPGWSVAADPPVPSAGDCFKTAFEANDADAVAACYAEDGVIWFPGGPMAKGRAAIRDGFAGYLATMKIKGIKMSEMGKEASGDTMVTWGNYVITSVDKATEAESVVHGRYTEVSKLINGKWLYVADHASDDPAAAPTDE